MAVTGGMGADSVAGAGRPSWSSVRVPRGTVTQEPDYERTRTVSPLVETTVRLIMAANERAKYFVSGKGFESELAASYPVGAGDDVACRVLVRFRGRMRAGAAERSR